MYLLVFHDNNSIGLRERITLCYCVYFTPLYRVCGFKIQVFMKTQLTFWLCIYPTPVPEDDLSESHVSDWIGDEMFPAFLRIGNDNINPIGRTGIFIRSMCSVKKWIRKCLNISKLNSKSLIHSNYRFQHIDLLGIIMHKDVVPARSVNATIIILYCMAMRGIPEYLIAQARTILHALSVVIFKCTMVLARADSILVSPRI